MILVVLGVVLAVLEVVLVVVLVVEVEGKFVFAPGCSCYTTHVFAICTNMLPRVLGLNFHKCSSKSIEI